MEESHSSDHSEGHKALLELEKKFNKKARSSASNIQGSQIQALTGFIQIFDQYPYPVVINAAILKLADWFRIYNNHVKYYIYRVFKGASESQLCKVINVEETVRRILPVLGSNDPTARAIALRVFGCMSVISSNNLDVHYGIIQQMELATDRIELEAAIWAADQICARSKTFPSVIFPKIVEKLQNPNTPLEIKTKIIKIFRHMHQDIGMAREAKSTCLQLLQDKTTDTQLVLVTLRTLTLLSSQVVIDRKEQIERLIDYSLNDERDLVRYNVFYDLVLLGRNDTMLDETHIIHLLEAVKKSQQNKKIHLKAIHCARKVIESHHKLILHMMDPTSSSREYEPLSYIRELEAMMQNAIQQQQYTITIAIAKLLYSILRIILGQQNPAHSSTAMDVDSNVLSELKALGQRVTEIITKMDIELIKQDKTLRAISKLRLQELLKIKSDFCLLLDDWDCDTTFKEAYTLLTKADDDIVAVLLPYLSSLSQKCKLLPTWFPNEALNEMKKRMNRPLIFVNLNRLLVRTTKSSDELMNQLLPILHRFGSFNRKRERYQSNAWNLYLIGLEAGHCGWYQLLYLIMKDLCRNVEKEANFYWLRSLGSLALAEWTLSQNQPGTDHYIQCLKELKALSAFRQPRPIQSGYVQLRMEFIEIVQRMKEIISTTIKDSNDKKQSRQMRCCAIQFRKLAFKYDFLAQSKSAKKLDREMLDAIETYKTCALVCEHATQTFVGSDHSFFCIDPSLIPLIAYNEPTMPSETLQQLPSQHLLSSTTKRMMYRSKDFLCKVIQWEDSRENAEVDFRSIYSEDLRIALDTILAEPLILPKSFFSSMKSPT